MQHLNKAYKLSRLQEALILDTEYFPKITAVILF